ncbi:hypothetical protein N7540_000690 [Penicillium herquei]|nr:hypothetical protein N7540_000690 [Penicillium herquei]
MESVGWHVCEGLMPQRHRVKCEITLFAVVLTLQFLGETNVLEPSFYEFNTDPNPVGVGYILMENLLDHSLRWSVTNLEQRKKVIEQLSDMHLELFGHSFTLSDSLHNSSSHASDLGPFAQDYSTEYRDAQMKTETATE